MMNQTFTWEMVGNHQTSILNWLFGVPGKMLFFPTAAICEKLRQVIVFVDRKMGAGASAETLANASVEEVGL